MDFILGYVLHTKMHLCLWDDLQNLLTQLTDKINNGQKVVNPFPLLSLLDDPDIQRKAAEIYVNEYFPQSYVLPKIFSYPKHTKIKIGYFSADFNNHPVAILTAELYETHDRSQFEIYAFSYGPDTNDALNVRIKAGVDHFYDVHNLMDKDVALLARNLEIDIAVDLGGFTVNSRIGIFAMQAAPIQVNYLGYPGTLMAEYFDYIIADATVIPENNQLYYSERVAYLPNSFMVSDTKQKLSNRVFTRDEVGLPINGFVFCCFNSFYKITPDVFAIWMRVLFQVEGSVLWLPEGNLAAVNDLKEEANKNNIDANRLIFAPRLPSMEDHLNRLLLADLFIDTLPYNAHTTASDAFKMGLPVLTCMGESFASRVATSLLNAVNLPELITTNPEDYEALALDLAIHSEKLTAIKTKLLANLSTAPLYNTSLYVQHLESAYKTMVQRNHDGLAPDHIVVDTLGSLKGLSKSHVGLRQHRPDIKMDDKDLHKETLLEDSKAINDLKGPPVPLNNILPLENSFSINNTSPLQPFVLELLEKGNIIQADNYLRMMLEVDPNNPFRLNFLGWISSALNLHKFAVTYFKKAIEQDNNWDLPLKNIEIINNYLKAEIDDSYTLIIRNIEPKYPKYLLIKAWGYGFWADVSHVLGQLLIAELTGRLPVVYWGENSLFGDGTVGNAFDYYFENFSTLDINQLQQSAVEYWPPKWNNSNLKAKEVNKWTGHYSRIAGQYLLNRPGNVVISDFYSGVIDIKPWIPFDHPSVIWLINR